MRTILTLKRDFYGNVTVGRVVVALIWVETAQTRKKDIKTNLYSRIVRMEVIRIVCDTSGEQITLMG